MRLLLGEGRERPHLLVKFRMPQDFPAGIVAVEGNPLVVKHGRETLGLPFGEVPSAGPDVGPSHLVLLQQHGKALLGLRWVARAQGCGHLLPAHHLHQIRGNALPEPVDTGSRVFEGPTHRKHHVYHPCVALGRC